MSYNNFLAGPLTRDDMSTDVTYLGRHFDSILEACTYAVRRCASASGCNTDTQTRKFLSQKDETIMKRIAHQGWGWPLGTRRVDAVFAIAMVRERPQQGRGLT